MTRQGRNGPGGSKNYTVNGKINRGLRVCGLSCGIQVIGGKDIMVGPGGVVYEKDLGPRTNVVAGTMKECNPNSSWQEAEDQQEKFAGTQKTDD